MSQERESNNFVLDHKSITCMHCRFYKDSFHNFRNKLGHISESTELSKFFFKKSVDNLNNPVVLLGIPTRFGTTEFSVASEDHYF